MNRSEGIWTVEPEYNRGRREEIFLTHFERTQYNMQQKSGKKMKLEFQYWTE